jgi:hypothetical protein
MQRREFIKLVGVAAGTWPLSARAQKAGTKIPRIGYIGTTPRAPDEAFRQRLRELGYNSAGPSAPGVRPRRKPTTSSVRNRM